MFTIMKMQPPTLPSSRLIYPLITLKNNKKYISFVIYTLFYKIVQLANEQTRVYSNNELFQ